jgi:hypothetical protein
MIQRTNKSISTFLFSLAAGMLVLSLMSSCGKQAGGASPTGLNVQYHVLNLSPDLGPLTLFIDFKTVNQSPFVFNFDPGYFYVPSLDTPYQIRSALASGTPVLSRDDILRSRGKYTLYIIGEVAAHSVTSVFTVDTSAMPALGRGKLRFVNVSPTATGGLDVYANGTLAFKNIVYKKFSDYIELPIGNYDLQVTATGSGGILSEQPTVTIQDGKLYTLYAHGYSTRTDTAVFTTSMITNR